jgi:hypothetical protein
MKLLMLPKAKKPDHFACKMGLHTMANFVKIGKRGKEGMKREKPSPSQKSKTQLALITGKGTNHSIRPV